MKIAIIGTRISALSTAYHLDRKIEIDMYDSNDRMGGHTHTHHIELDNNNYSVDTGFIVYNERTYPNFIKLLDQLGVERQLSTMGFSVKSVNEDYEYSGESLNTLFAKDFQHVNFQLYNQNPVSYTHLTLPTKRIV